MVVVGQSRIAESAAAGRECAEIALAGLQPDAEPGWALAFCGGRHDPEAVFAALRDGLRGIPVIGGSAIGVVTNAGGGYNGYECAVALFPAAGGVPVILSERGLDDDEAAAGGRLGRRIADVAGSGRVVLLFYDSVASAPPPRLHPATVLLDALYAAAPNLGADIVGAGTVSNFQIDDSCIFDGERVARHAVVAAVLPPGIGAETAILHGCVPVSSFLEITRVDGAEVFEIDDRPALAVIAERFGMGLDDDRIDDLSLRATLGRKHGDPFSPYDERDYANRLILSVNRDTGSVTLFEPDFVEGTKVQIMSRDNRLMVESVTHGAAAMRAAVADRQPMVALYIDCAGRASAFSGGAVEEADEVVRAFAEAMPLIGFYSGVEIAPLKGRSRPLDWTAVLTVLVEAGSA